MLLRQCARFLQECFPKTCGVRHVQQINSSGSKMRDEVMKRRSGRSYGLRKRFFEQLIGAVIGAPLVLTATHVLAEPAPAPAPAPASDKLEGIGVCGDRLSVLPNT